MPFGAPIRQCAWHNKKVRALARDARKSGANLQQKYLPKSKKVKP